MTEEFYGNETIHIMKDLDEIDASASNVFGESIEMFVASTINFAMHQKLRYEAVQRDECPQSNVRLDTTKYIQLCETEIGRVDSFGRERRALQYQRPPTMLENEVGRISNNQTDTNGANA